MASDDAHAGVLSGRLVLPDLFVGARAIIDNDELIGRRIVQHPRQTLLQGGPRTKHHHNDGQIYRCGGTHDVCPFDEASI
jgi:hypothetical protein